MWLRSERRERRLRRTRSIILPTVVAKKPTLQRSPKNTTKIYASPVTTRSTSNPKVGLKRLVQRKTSHILNIAQSSKLQKLNEDGKENCWIDTTEVTLFDDQNVVKKSQNEKETDIGCASDMINQFGPININSDSNSSIISSCCSCDAEGLSSSKHEKLNSNLIKCISECDSTTGFDENKSKSERNFSIETVAQLSSSHGSSSSTTTTTTPSFEGVTETVNTNKSLFDVVPEVDSTTDFLLSAEKKSRDLFNLILPAGFYHNFPTPEITPTHKQFQCCNSLTNTYFDDDLNKTGHDVDTQFSDYVPCSSFFTQSVISGLNCPELETTVNQNLSAIDESSSDLDYLSLNQTAIDNLKALSNFQSSNFLNVTSRTDETESFIQNLQPQIENNSSISINNNEHETDVSNNDIQLETDECMEIEEILTWNTFDPYIFIKHLPPLTNIIRAKCPALPLKTRSSPEFTLVLDLDETLVHCSLQELSDASFNFPVLFQVRPKTYKCL